MVKKLLNISIICLISSCVYIETKNKIKLNWFTSKTANQIINTTGNIVKTNSKQFQEFGCLHISDIKKLSMEF